MCPRNDPCFPIYIAPDLCSSGFYSNKIHIITGSVCGCPLWHRALPYLEKDEDHAAGDVKDDIPFQPDRDQQEQVFCAFVKEYPNLKCIARHVRFAHSCSENSLLAYLWKDGQIYESRRLTFHILDRVGGGDAFVSGIIYGLMNDYTPEDTVNFGVAASAVKHTIHGDGNITDDVSLIRHVMEMNLISNDKTVR